jgi:hypothetical protein
MCDYVPGRILVVHGQGDALATETIAGLEGEGVFPIETMSAKLDRLGRALNPHLKLEFVQLAVPEGDEVWWIARLMEIYYSRARGPSPFAVSLNHHLELCGFSFTLGSHDATYRGLMQESRSSGDGKDVRVKVVDSGLSSTCGITATSEVNILDPSKPTDVEDQDGHGTAVTSVIHHLAPKAKLLIYKVKGATGSIIEWDVLAALADDDSAHVVNLSLAFGLATVNCPTCGRLSHSSRSAVFEGTLRRMAEVNNDTVIVAAAGNNGTSPLVYPARFREALAAGAVDSTGAKSSASNYGDLDRHNVAHDSLFFAPGGSASESVGHTTPGGKTYSGTSFGAAYASGLLAKLQSDPAHKGSAASLLTTLRGKANYSPKMVGYVKKDHGNGLLQI